MPVIRFSANTVFVVMVAVLTLFASAQAIDFKRDFSTDRPDKTESPYTVERGGIQVELSLLNGEWTDTKIGEGSFHSREAFFGGLLKYGLSKNLDIQLQFGYEGRSSWYDGVASTAGQSKFPSFDKADPIVRIKWNMKGNDEAGTAVALMPYVSLPLGNSPMSSDQWQGGLIVPVAAPVSGSIGIGFMNQIDLKADEDDDGHIVGYVASVTTAIDLSQTVGVFFELFQSVDLGQRTPWQPTFDTGVAIAVIRDTQLDFGMNFGLNKHAADFGPFIGFSFRI